MKKTLLTAATMIIVAAGSVLHPATAEAATSCGKYQKVSSSHYHGDAAYCPLWRGNVPVYNTGQTGSRHVVGYLTDGASANWFLCRWTTGSYSKYSAYGYTSEDWAYTYADNGHTGVVSAVFFASTSTRWSGLTECEDGFEG